ncbi:peptidoglycan DD-metalloendopeptidase family protein [Aquimarina sp. TRL1]|uniref:peptidoglycan DD-metalloendopeptidase family protein n=1 Tax=Aquimarina sp. (strain TRL1) TaxID=2736252 RepID=UPI00158B7F37|nr:peptidoglycan DD-metalloendopeptidase family protein [Aquimarina sp. TRL1]QKX05413.1 peptidoglycan DD-metalloendopeptidase family protein [Aquimarina sp. TRL1]
MKKATFLLAMVISTSIFAIQSHHTHKLLEKKNEYQDDGDQSRVFNSSKNNHCLLKFRIPIELRYLPYGYNTLYFITNYVDQDPGINSIKDWGGGEWTYDSHRGTDFALWPYPWLTMDMGLAFAVAAEDGIIIEKVDGNFDRNCGVLADIDENAPWNVVKVRHYDGTITIYAHLEKYSLTRKAVGQTVKKGEFLGNIGSAGYSDAPHLHFEIQKNGEILDPYLHDLWETKQSYLNPIVIGGGVHRHYPKLNPVTVGGGIPNGVETVDECSDPETIYSHYRFKSGEQIWVTSYIANQTPELKFENEVRKVKNNELLFGWDPSIVTEPLRNRNFWGYVWATDGGWYYYEAKLGDTSISKTYFYVEYRKILGLKILDFDPNGDFFHNTTTENRDFKEGEERTFVTYFHDANVGDQIQGEIYSPDGTLYREWGGTIENKEWTFWSEKVTFDNGDFGPNKYWVFKSQYNEDEPEYTFFTVSNDITNKSDNSLDEDQTLEKEKLIISPNPVKDIVHIKIPDNFYKNDLEISIHDLRGRKVYNTHLKTKEEGNNTMLDLSFLNENLYFLLIKDPNSGGIVFKEKLVKLK